MLLSFHTVQIKCQISLDLGIVGIYLLSVPKSFTPKHPMLLRAQRMMPHLRGQGEDNVGLFASNEFNSSLCSNESEKLPHLCVL